MCSDGGILYFFLLIHDLMQVFFFFFFLLKDLLYLLCSKVEMYIHVDHKKIISDHTILSCV